MTSCPKCGQVFELPDLHHRLCQQADKIVQLEDKLRDLHDYRHPMCDLSDDIIGWAADHIEGKKCADEARLIASLRKIATIGPVTCYNAEVEMRQEMEKNLQLAVRLLARANEHVNGQLRPEITDFITKIRTKT
jgi:hypothetical protein